MTKLEAERPESAQNTGGAQAREITAPESEIEALHQLVAEVMPLNHAELLEFLLPARKHETGQHEIQRHWLVRDRRPQRAHRAQPSATSAHLVATVGNLRKSWLNSYLILRYTFSSRWARAAMSIGAPPPPPPTCAGRGARIGHRPVHCHGPRGGSSTSKIRRLVS
jgi:hypothetical protein